MKYRVAAQEENSQIFDPYLLERIEPKGGISFKAIDYIRTGNGFEACLNIYDFPIELNENWMTTICAIEGVTTTIDIHTEEKKCGKEKYTKSITRTK